MLMRFALLSHTKIVRYSDCRSYLFPDPIKLVCTAANDSLSMLIEDGDPCLTRWIRELDDHDVPERAS
jgi:hypothetical protein